MNYFLRMTDGSLYGDYLVQTSLCLIVLMIVELERARIRIERYQFLIVMRRTRGAKCCHE